MEVVNPGAPSEDPRLTLTHEEFLQYKRREKIGRGTFSKVYRYELAGADDQRGRLPPEIAVKIIDIDDSLHLGVVDYQRELELAQDMSSHAHVVRTFGVFEVVEKKKFALAMELCQCTLHDVMKENTSGLDYQTVARLMQQQIEGVAALHGQNIFHRDLKPRNILVNYFDPTDSSMSDSCLKISDFGLSKYLTQDDSSMTSNVGTRKFSAPEVEEGRTDYGISADIWSLGIIAYFLSTGSLPDKELREDGTATYLFNNDSVTSFFLASFLLGQLQTDKERRMTARDLLEHPFLDGEDAVDRFLNYCKSLQILHGDTGFLAKETEAMDLQTMEIVSLPPECSAKTTFQNILVVEKRQEYLQLLDMGQRPYRTVFSVPDNDWISDIRLDEKHLVVCFAMNPRIVIFKRRKGSAASEWDSWRKVFDFEQEVSSYIVSLKEAALTVLLDVGNTVRQFDLEMEMEEQRRPKMLTNARLPPSLEFSFPLSFCTLPRCDGGDGVTCLAQLLRDGVEHCLHRLEIVPGERVIESSAEICSFDGFFIESMLLLGSDTVVVLTEYKRFLLAFDLDQLMEARHGAGAGVGIEESSPHNYLSAAVLPDMILDYAVVGKFLAVKTRRTLAEEWRTVFYHEEEIRTTMPKTFKLRVGAVVYLTMLEKARRQTEKMLHTSPVV